MASTSRGARSDPTGRLDQYRAKRDFGATPEPPGHRANQDQQRRFVVQEHHATSLHWDLRLEHDGVLASWAVPKGIPPDPRVNRLAVQTEDHPLEYLTFAGTIPSGSYGAGTMAVWDSGTYTCEKYEPGEVIVTFHGSRVSGRHALIRTRNNQWLLHRVDPPEDPSRELLPEGWTPMEPEPGGLPSSEKEWTFTPDWGGRRAVVAFEGGRVSAALDSTRADLAPLVPELGRLGEALGTLQIVLDIDIIVTDEEGRPDVDSANTRWLAPSSAAVRRRTREHPATVLIQDLLWLEGHSALSLPWSERRRLLDELTLHGSCWQTPTTHVGDGTVVLEAVSGQGLEGVLAKRLDSIYEPGIQSPNWRAIGVG